MNTGILQLLDWIQELGQWIAVVVLIVLFHDTQYNIKNIFKQWHKNTNR